jgi:alpha-L-rhamnosidase
LSSRRRSRIKRIDDKVILVDFGRVAFDLEPEGKGGSIAKWMAGRGMRCSVYAARYFMEALFENGQSAAALKLMTADNDRSWKHMADSGTTITWEAWDMKYKPNQDWNHAWGAAPANLLPRYLLGVEHAKPGWELASIRPYTGELSFAKGTVPTPRGPILIDWKNEATFTISIQLPGDMPAKLNLPARDGTTTVTVNGNPAKAERLGDRWILQDPVTGDARIEVK